MDILEESQTYKGCLNGKMSLSALPLECLDEILRCLSTRDVVAVGCSCSALRRVTSSSSRLWRRVCFSRVANEHEEVVRSLLKQYGHWAHSVHVSTTLPYGKIVKLLASCKSCTSLSLRFQSARSSSISPVQLKALCSQLSCLKSVELWNRTSNAACLTDVVSLLSGLTNLDDATLHLSGVHPGTLLQAWVSLRCRPRCISLHTDFSQDDLLPQMLSLLKGHSSWTMSVAESSTFTCCVSCADPLEADMCKPEIQVSLGANTAPFVMIPIQSLSIPVKGSCSLVQTTLRTVAVFTAEEMPSVIPCTWNLHVVTHLNLSKLRVLEASDILSHVAESCKELMALNVSGSVGVMLNLAGLQSVILHCSKLRFIDVSGIPIANADVAHFWEILSSSSLTHLTVGNCSLSSANSLAVGQATRPLQECPNDDVWAICSSLTSLQALELRCCNVAAKKHVCLSCSAFSASQLAKVQVFAHLSYLACYTSTVKPYSLKSILSECRALQCLRFEYRSMQLQAGGGSLCLPGPSPGLYASLTQLCIVSTVLTLSDDICEALGQNGKLTHIFLLIQAMSLKAIEQLLRGNRRLAAVQIIFMSFLGKHFKTFVQKLSSDFKDHYAVQCGRFTIKDNCLRQVNLLSAMTADVNSNLGTLWKLAP